MMNALAFPGFAPDPEQTANILRPGWAGGPCGGVPASYPARTLLGGTVRVPLSNVGQMAPHQMWSLIGLRFINCTIYTLRSPN